MPADLPPRLISGLAFVGRGGGQVKALGGFRKGHHSVPDVANPVTHAFLGKLCAGDLAAEAEDLFQRLRTGLGYKRKDISLQLAPAVATLAARDFQLEIAYALEPSDPARFAVVTALRELRELAVAQSEALADTFAGRFTELSFELARGTSVEAVIDLIEGLDAEVGLTVDYPSDCRTCTIRVPEVDAVVRCTGATLDMVFPRGAAPADLLQAFAAVREAFQVSKPLAGLIG
jgi:hypothetical protein